MLTKSRKMAKRNDRFLRTMEFLLSVMLLICVTQGSLSQLQLEPRSLSVLRGGTARLTCSTTAPWEVMLWYLNNTCVLTVSFRHGILGHYPSVSAVDRSTAKQSSWEFILTNALRSHQGTVSCELQTIQRETSTLLVQEGGSVAISGGNRTVLRGQLIQLECLAVGWDPEPRLVWRLNSLEVNNGHYNINSEVSDDGLHNVTSAYSVKATTSSHVECLASVSALPVPLASYIQLTVVAEVLSEAEDCTVQLAVAASALTLFLLFLLGLWIVLCCKWTRRSKSKKNRIRTDQSKRQSSPGWATGGTVNTGYTPEALTAVHDGELINEVNRQVTALNLQKIPDVASCLHNLELHSKGSKVIRSVTTV